jgi:hypothetical protein
MKTFTVGFSYTVYGTAMHIEAETKEEAEKWLFDELEQNGLDEFEHKVNDRDYHTQDAEEVKE